MQVREFYLSNRIYLIFAPYEYTLFLFPTIEYRTGLSKCKCGCNNIWREHNLYLSFLNFSIGCGFSRLVFV